MRDRMIAMLVAAMQQLLCQFFEICLNHEDCPDGICNDAQKDIFRLEEDMPRAVAPGKLNSVSVNWQWDRLSEVADAVRQLVLALRAFMGADRPVG